MESPVVDSAIWLLIWDNQAVFISPVVCSKKEGGCQMKQQGIKNSPIFDML